MLRNTEPRSSGLQLMVYAGDQVRCVDLPADGAVTIGRDRGSVVHIDDLSVSRQHAVIHVGPPLVLEDLGRPNGTLIRDRIGDERLGQTVDVRQLRGGKAELAVGDVLLFGTAHVIVRHAAPVEASSPDEGEPPAVVRDPALRRIYDEAGRAAPTMLSVLILGETGVGKEVLARTIHARSPRCRGPFLGVDLSALNESTLESELFGHERGAFTGAIATRVGLLESANGGTVFLDEASNLSLATQAKLLRVLELREITRLGSNRPRAIDVRFVAASNRDLEADCASGSFRRDLFFRLNGLSLVVPPLRERPLDLEPLARRFLSQACRQVERATPPALSPDALETLRRHPWPGNVRELRNAMERAAALCPGDTIRPEHLPPSVATARPSAPVSSEPPSARRADGDLLAELRATERVRIVEALARSAGNQSQAARELGISRGMLIARLDEYGLPRPRKRDPNREE